MTKILVIVLSFASWCSCNLHESSHLDLPQLDLKQSHIKAADNYGDKHRVKRKIFNFFIHPSKKWDTPIKYMFDREFTDEQKDIVNHIIQGDFMAHTCIQFLPISIPPPGDEQFIRFRINDNERSCFSEVGREENTATVHGQPIYLGRLCFNNRNGVLYTIASTLGMLNEVNRPDRDYYVQLEENHISSEDRFNFAIHSSDYFSVHDIPYDYGSIMHAAPDHGMKNGTQAQNASALTVVPIDRQYMYVPGQACELSSYDYKAINLVYCNATCSYRKACENGGYQDPKACHKCKCRDGYAGTSCELVTPGTDTCTPSSGRITVTRDVQCVQSPNYNTPENPQYRFGDMCAWQLSAPEGRLIDVWFEELDLLAATMSLYSTCFHWVEIRNNGLDQARGLRYCNNTNRNMLKNGFVQEAVVPMNEEKHITTRSHETMIIFRTPEIVPNHYDTLQPDRNGGFTLCYKISDTLPEDLEPLRPPLPPSESPEVVDSAEASGQTERKNNNNDLLLIGIAVAVVLLLLILLMCCGIIACMVKKKKVPTATLR